MDSSPNAKLADNPLRQSQVAQCRQELEHPHGLLQFAQPLEQEFRRHLRQSYFRAANTFLLIGLVIWLGFAGLDVLRYRDAVQADLQQVFWWNVFIPRTAILVLGLLFLWLLRSRRVSALSPAMPWLEYGFIFLLSTVAIVTSNFYTTHQLLAAKSSSVILVMVCFLPMGSVFRQSVWLALAVFLTDMLVGYWILPPAMQAEQGMVSSVVGVALVLSGFNFALREKATREQFLLRMLLRWEAAHDPLTGLANRRHFEEWAQTGLRQAHREQLPVALAIVDVDHFKAYNDRYGHQQGDYALQQLADLLQKYASRPLDLTVRLGGEEFAIICYGETAASLERRLQQLLQELRAMAIPHALSPTAATMTASVGVCEAGADESLESFYQRTDQALYRAKASGRNQIVLGS